VIVAWIERSDLRRRRAKTWRDDAAGVFHTHASIADLHYESAVDSGAFDAPIDATPVRVNNAALDGWRVTANGWHYALGEPGSGALAGLDGVVGFGGRQGAHWLLSRLTRVGYLHWPTRAWQDVGGAPSYVRANLSSAVQTKRVGPPGAEVDYPISSLATWSRIWTTPGGGQLDIRWRVAGRDLKEEIVVNQAAREWIAANRPPTTPANETYFGFVFRIDPSDIPKWLKNGLLQDPAGDFDDGNGRLEIRDALDRLLAFLPIDQAYSAPYARGAHTAARDWRTLRKRIWRDPDGNTYLLVGALVTDLNSMNPGAITFDPTFTVAETNEDGASEDTNENVLPSQGSFGSFYVGEDPGPVTLDSGWIWRSTGITSGATILTASTVLTNGDTGDYQPGFQGDWFGFAVDSPSDFVNTHTHRISDHHARTGTPIADDSWANTATHTSPSLVSPVQEIVDRAGFAGDVGLTWRCDTAGGTGWWQWDDYTDSAANAADLVVTWSSEDLPGLSAAFGESLAIEVAAESFVFWLMPEDVVVEDMPALGVLEEQIADFPDPHDFVFWQAPEDVEDALIGAVVFEESEAAFDDTLYQWVGWLTPEDVEDPLVGATALVESEADFDDTLYQWVGWQAPEDVEDPPLSVAVFEESEAVATEALEWFAAATEDLVEEPPIAAALITDLFESDDTEHNWTAWQVPDDVLPEDFMPGALLVMAEAEFRSDDTLLNWLAGPNYLGGLPGFTLGLVRVTSGVKAAGVTSGLKAAKVATMYKGVRDGTTD